ncbi:MAG: serine/threonine-protein kinase [Thermoanaerobaculia bacterium]
MLSKDRWSRLRPHLDRALELDGLERAAWLASLAAEDASLADELRVLLEEHGELDRERFLGDAPPQPPRASLVGQTIGAYTVLSKIGQGGMGSVWLARRSDGRFEGQAALKLLNASLIGRSGEERFRREGSILARLHHPHIARLLDAGVSPSGQPYLVLEHVEGEPIDRYCDGRKLGIAARLRLFLDVLAAVADAHAKLIVHRDIKPSNVLVGNDGQVKLLDFGIAKLIENEGGSGEATAMTREGGGALTPEYAAPEQVTGGSVTIATDVYTLGTLLYLLLSGRHPAGAALGSPAELMRTIVDVEPQRLSQTVAKTFLSPEASMRIAEARSTSPEGLRRALDGDLDTTVAKALKKNPAERYASVGALAEDIRRYLEHQPIAARPDTLGYRAGKFVRRHRVGVAATVLVAAAALVGTAVTLWQAREARKERDDARAQLARATAVKDFLGFLLSAAAPAGRQYSVSELLEQGEVVIDRQFAADDGLRAEMLAAVGQQHMNAERFAKAAQVLERSAAIAERAGDPILRARALCPLALAKLATEANLRESQEMISRALAGLPDDPRHATLRGECLTQRAAFGFFTDDGEAMVRDAVDAVALFDATPLQNQSARIDARSALAYGYYLTRQNAKADQTYAQVMTALERSGRERTIAAADAWNNWALVHFGGDIKKAELLMRRSLELRRSIEGRDAVAPTFLFNYAGVLYRLAQYDEAEHVFQETIRTARDRQMSRIEVDAMMQLADLYTERGDFRAAEEQLNLLTPHLSRPYFNPLKRALLAYSRGLLALGRGDPVRARAELAESTALFESAKARLAQNVHALIGLARAEAALGNMAAAEATARRAIALAESLVEKGAPSYLVGRSKSALGEIQLARGQTEAGRSSLNEALAHLEPTLGTEHPATSAARRRLAVSATGAP